MQQHFWVNPQWHAYSPSAVVTYNVLHVHRLHIVYMSICLETLREISGMWTSFWPAVLPKSNVLRQIMHEKES